MQKSPETQISRASIPKVARPGLLLALLLSTFLWAGCQENPDVVGAETGAHGTKAAVSASQSQAEIEFDSAAEATPRPALEIEADAGETPKPATEISAEAEASPNTDAGSGICKLPGPITRTGSTPRCTDHEEPVCGCDGKTYLNDCMAWSNDVNVAHEGPCGQVPAH